MLAEAAANQALTRARSVAALCGVLIHAGLSLLWDVTPWMLGISAIHLLFTSMVVAESDTRFAPVAIVFDSGVAVSLAVVAGDARVAVPWLVVLVPMLLAVVRPRMGLGLLAVVPLGGGLALILVDVVARPAALTDDRVATYLAVSAIAVVAVAAVLILEVGWSLRRQAGELDGRIRQLEMLTESSPIGMAIQDRHGRFIYMNPRLHEMLGLTPQQVEATGATEAVPAGVLDRIEPMIIDAQLNRRSLQFSHAVKRADGSLAWLDVAMSEPLLQPDGAPLYVFTVLEVTEKIATTIRSQRFAQAIDATTDLVAVWDALRRRHHVNAAFLQFFGSTADARDRAFECIMEKLDESYPHWSQLPEGSTIELETDLPRGATGAPVPFSLVVTVAQDQHEGGRSFAVIARDVSRHRAALNEARNAALAKNQLLSAVSGELRSPLSAVLGFATELADNLARFSAGEVADLTRLIAVQSGEMARITDDLLAAARADVDELAVEPTDVRVGSAVQDVLRSVGAGSDVSIDPSVDELHVLADPTRLRQILRHLLMNALSHARSAVRVEGAVRGHAAMIIVADNRTLSTEADQAFPAEPPTRGHEGGETEQDPLKVSRMLARLMSGDLAYRHREGWSEFVVTLPIGATDMTAGTTLVVDDTDITMGATRPRA